MLAERDREQGPLAGAGPHDCPSAEETVARASRHLRTGPGDVVDRIEAWLAEEADYQHPDREISRLRHAAIAHDPELRAKAHQHLEQVQSEIAAAVARDTGVDAEDVGPQTFAGAAVAFLFALRKIGLEARAGGPAQSTAGIAFLRAGLAAITGPS